MRRAVGVTLLLLLIYAISQAPGPWGDAGQHLGAHIAEGAKNIGVFLTALVT